MKKQLLRKYPRLCHLETKRLYLRIPRTSDRDDMYEYARLPQVAAYLLREPHSSPACTGRYLSYLCSRCKSGDFYFWAICLKQSDKMIGTCGFNRLDMTNGLGEIGYVINPRYQSEGYGTEAVRRIIDFGFYELMLNRIEARYIVGNEKSLRLAQKVGMTPEGVLREALYLRGSYTSVGICSVLKSEYSASVALRDIPN